MKQVVLQRAWSDYRATLGMIKILDHDHPPLFTLENPLRATTVDSRIPGGDYICTPYSGTKFKDVYLVKDVPNRTAILFHVGNFERDTEGCILVGLGAGMMKSEPAVMQSQDGFAIFKAVIGQQNFKLWIIDRFDQLETNTGG